MIYPCPPIVMIAVSLMQGVAFLIASIELGGVYQLQFRGWELARERRWSFCEIGGNFESDRIFYLELH
eukprot:scaffold47545_cov73-Cyclotella_meneghiniana.AAC.1